MKTTERHKNRQDRRLTKATERHKKKKKSTGSKKKTCQRLMYRILHNHFWFVLGKTVKQDL